MKQFKILYMSGLLVTATLPLASSQAQTVKPSEATATPAVDSATLIVPGQSVGQIQLGDTQEKVKRILGTWASMSLNGRIGDEAYGYNSGLTIYFRDYKVDSVRVSSKAYKTAEGVSVGSSSNDIRHLFKSGTLTPFKVGLTDNMGKVLKYVTSYNYSDAKRGVIFQFGASGNYIEDRHGIDMPPIGDGKLSTSLCRAILVVKPKP
jgi:hypothetical protein